MEFILSLISGVVASIIILTTQFVIKKCSEIARYKKIQGKYHVYNIENGEQINNEIIKIKYLNGNILQIESTDNPGREWKGTIIMDKTVPQLGRGVYQYTNKNDCGRHEIQLKDYNSIFVYGENTSHGNLENMFTYMLKRIRK